PTIISIFPVTTHPVTVTLTLHDALPISAGAVNVDPLTPVPLHTILVTVVPAGNVAVSVAAEPGQSVPIAPKVGAGAFATVNVRLPDTANPFTVALRVIV